MRFSHGALVGVYLLASLAGCGPIMSSRRTSEIPDSPGEVQVTTRKCTSDQYPFYWTVNLQHDVWSKDSSSKPETMPEAPWLRKAIQGTFFFLPLGLMLDAITMPYEIYEAIAPSCIVSKKTERLPYYPVLLNLSEKKRPQGSLLTLYGISLDKNPVVWFGKIKRRAEPITTEAVSVRIPTEIVGPTTVMIETTVGKTASLPLFITPTKPPLLRAVGLEFSSAKNDGVLSSRESANISFTLTNAEGAGDSLEVTGSATATGRIDISIPDKVAIGAIRAGESKRVAIPIQGGLDLQTGKATITVSFEEATGFPPDPIKINFGTRRLEVPDLTIANVVVDDNFYPGRNDRLSVGNGNGIIEPGESVEISARLGNVGTGRATQSTVRVSCDLEGVSFLSPTSFSPGDIPPGGWAELRFVLSVRKGIPASGIPLTLHITDAVSKFNMALPLQLEIGKAYSNVTVKEVKDRSRAPEKKGFASFGDDLFPPPKARTQNSDAIAVIIGVRNYKNPDVPIVEYALNDAAAFKAYAVTSLGIKPENIIYSANPSKGELERIFGTAGNHKGQLFNYLKNKNSDVFVYYSGHGAPDFKSHAAYLVPSDADPNYVSMNGYPLQRLVDNLNALPSRKTLLILDACFSGSSDAGTLIAQASPLVGVVSKPKYGRVNVFASSSSDEISSWYQEKQHGMFTYFFLKGIQVLGQRKSSTTTAEVRDYLAENLPPMARRLHGREQTPEYTGDKGLILLRY